MAETPNAIESVGIDACVAIDMIQKAEPYYSALAPLLAEAEANARKKRGPTFVLCTTSIAEVTKLDAADGSVDKQTIEAMILAVRQFFSKECFQVVEAGWLLAEETQRIRRRSKLSVADAMSLATAAIMDAPYLLTRDGEARPKSARRLLTYDNVFRTSANRPIRIMTPADFRDVPYPLLAKGNGAS